jgi:hypothetical protein
MAFSQVQDVLPQLYILAAQWVKTGSILGLKLCLLPSQKIDSSQYR